MKPVPLVAAVALAAFLVRRRRRLEPTLLIGGALVAVGLAVYGTGVVQLPNLEDADPRRRRDARAVDVPARRRRWPSSRPARSSA